MKPLSTGVIALALCALTQMAQAQTAEIFIPGASPAQLQDTTDIGPDNPLAACLANANAANCDGIELDPDGIELESFATGPAIAYETLVFDLGGDSVTTSDAPSNYSDAATVDPYAQPVDPSGALSLPAVAITVEFDFNSDVLRADQIGKLQSLSAAFRDPALVGAQFAVIGHTDAAGSDAYNCDLSRRRAAEVSDALRARFVTLPLFQIGFGERVLKDIYNPSAAENRRVTFLRLPADYQAVLQTSLAVCGG